MPPSGGENARGGPRRVSAAGGARRVAGSVTSATAGIEPVASRGPRRLAKPKAVRVRADETGRPLKIEKREVDAVRESWLVEDRWWTDAPLRRRYWEVVTGDGRDLVVFRDLIEGRWYAQR
jgi:hypothetical protein